MGCVRGGGGWTDGRAREQDRKGLEDVAEEAAVLREAGGRRAAGQRVVGLRTTSMERYNRVARMCRSRGWETLRGGERVGAGAHGDGSEVWAALTCGWRGRKIMRIKCSVFIMEIKWCARLSGDRRCWHAGTVRRENRRFNQTWLFGDWKGLPRG